MSPSSAFALGAANGVGSAAHRADIPSAACRVLTYGAALTSTWTGARIAGINFVDYLLIAAVFCALLAAASRGRKLPIYGWALLPPVVLIVVALIGSVVRGDPLSSNRTPWERVVGAAIGAEYTGALPLIARMALALTAVTIIVVGSSEGERDRNAFIQRLIFTWAIGAAISGTVGVVEHVANLGNLPFLYQIVSDTRVTGLANHPNSFGQTIAYALPTLIYMLGRTHGLAKGALAVILPLSMYAVFLSGSRGALLLGSLLATTSFVYLAGTGKRHNIWFVPVMALLIALSIVAMPAFLNSTRFFDESGRVSDALRRANLERGLDLFYANPIFGAGVGSWNAEMVPLILLTSGGILYLIVFYGCLAYPLLMRPRSSGWPFVSILIITTVGYFAFGVLNNGIVERYLYWPFAALFALSLANRSESKASDLRANY